MSAAKKKSAKKANLSAGMSRKAKKWSTNNLWGDLPEWKKRGNQRAIEALLRSNPRAAVEMIQSLSKGKDGQAVARAFDQKVPWSGTAMLRDLVGKGYLRHEGGLRYTATRKGRALVAEWKARPAAPAAV